MRKEGMTTKEVVDRLAEGYWICFTCAKELGAKTDGRPHTVSMQTCTICKEVKACNSKTDWHWPKGYNIIYVWD